MCGLNCVHHGELHVQYYMQWKQTPTQTPHNTPLHNTPSQCTPLDKTHSMLDLSMEVVVEPTILATSMVKPPTPGLVNGGSIMPGPRLTAGSRGPSGLPPVNGGLLMIGGGTSTVGGLERYEPPLAAKVHLKLCEWLWYLAKQEAVCVFWWGWGGGGG